MIIIAWFGLVIMLPVSVVYKDGLVAQLARART